MGNTGEKLNDISKLIGKLRTDYPTETNAFLGFMSKAEVGHFDAIALRGAAAILSLGAEQDGKAEFTQSCDQRVVYDAGAARFLQTLALLLNEPEGLGITTISDAS